MSLDFAPTEDVPCVSREQLVHTLYEAAELEHNLMCTYLYAAFSLRDGEAEGLSTREAAAVARWRQTILGVAIEEMGHLTAIWNITSALGASPRFGRGNFPLDPGYLPAGVVVKLAPFDAAVLQHFIHLERPSCSDEPDGAGFAPDFAYTRAVPKQRLTPMPMDYATVGTFYSTLAENLSAFVARVGEAQAFAGDPALQLSPRELALTGAQEVICSKTALRALANIVEQGEGAPQHSQDSHFQRFLTIRGELEALLKENPSFRPAHPSAVNPVLRRPLRAEGRVWIELDEAAETVDLANAAYALMLRLLAHAYALPRSDSEKALAIDLGLALMRAVTHLAERAARLPAGATHPGCNAGMSFTALRDAAPLPAGAGARRFFLERLGELAAAATRLERRARDRRTEAAARQLRGLVERAERGFARAAAEARRLYVAPSEPPSKTLEAQPDSKIVEGVEIVEGEKLTLMFEAKKCIHARFCVTGAPKVFLANVQGPWIHPDAMDVESLVGIAHVCPSGAIRYARKDGRADEMAPPVNLLSIREAGPYAVRAELLLDGKAHGYRATLCRCGASKHKPFCDGSHHDVAFAASGEPSTTVAEMLPVRDGVLDIAPELDGPLSVRGNVEIISGTGRVVARVTQARLCRCGASANKPFCDNSHVRIGFKSD